MRYIESTRPVCNLQEQSRDVTALEVNVELQPHHSD